MPRTFHESSKAYLKVRGPCQRIEKFLLAISGHLWVFSRQRHVVVVGPTMFTLTNKLLREFPKLHVSTTQVGLTCVVEIAAVNVDVNSVSYVGLPPSLQVLSR